MLARYEQNFVRDSYELCLNPLFVPVEKLGQRDRPRVVGGRITPQVVLVSADAGAAGGAAGTTVELVLHSEGLSGQRYVAGLAINHLNLIFTDPLPSWK